MKQFLSCLRFFILLMILTGVLYPVGVALISKALFHDQSLGSPVMVNDKTVGSALLSQKTESPKYFWPRPSAGSYATVPSGASNFGPSSAALKKAIADNAAKVRAAGNLPADASLPDDLITTSASGLDPHISPAAARIQIDRVASARGFDAAKRAELAALVERHVEQPQLGFLGDARVNVLLLNIDLDRL